MQREKLFLIVITGPTAVGKTTLSIELAQYLKCDILSADSRQFYREISIGTAKPTQSEMSGVTHHFVGHLTIEQPYNVSKFEMDAMDVLTRLYANHNVAIVTGGSGLYIDALCNGIDLLPDPDVDLRRQLQYTYDTEGIVPLQEQLKALDIEYYNVVDLQNYKRLMRAIEVCLTSGQTFTQLRTFVAKKRPFEVIKIALNLPREELFQRINQRVDIMMEQGLLQEAEQFIPYKEYNALNTVGYKELFSYFDGKVSLSDAVANIKTNTRRYAKRQLTWFKKDEDYVWFSPQEKEEVIKYILMKINA